MTSELTAITITANDEQWLAEFAKKLVKEKLAACGNIIPKVRSIYAWNGTIEDDQEVLLILHTQATHIETIIKRTIEEHPYDEPQIVALPVANTSPGYGQWVLRSTAV